MKIKIAIVLLILTGAVIIWLQFQTQKTLRAENESLRQQIAQLQTDNESLSNRLTAAADTKSLPDEQLNELLKLRGEVGVLRNQIAGLGKVREENQQLQAQTAVAKNQLDQIAAEAAIKQRRIDMRNAMKQLVLAMRIYAGDHNDQYATNFDQFQNELGGVTNFQGNVGLDTFEFMNVGLVNDTMPQMIIFREQVSRQISNGQWERVYGLADGSVQTVTSDDVKFTVWGQQHSPQLNQ